MIRHVTGTILLFLAMAAFAQTDAQLFDKAQGEFNSRDFKTSRETLSRLIKRFPKSSYLARANMLFGDTFYEEKDYAAAADAYSKVLEIKDAENADEALIKTANCYEALKDDARALMALWRLVDFYPESPLVASARERIDTINRRVKSPKG